MAYVTHADLGGRPSGARVVPEAEGEFFHAAWEPRALALALAMGATGSWNIDMSRAARETLANYPELSYYEIWFEALERLIAGRGLASDEEMTRGESMQPPRPLARVLESSQVAAALGRGSPTERQVSSPPRFEAGSLVRMRSEVPDHHTRLPAYVRGRAGRVERVHGAHVFADAHALGLGEQPQWLYGVAFSEAELWPGRPPQGLTVSVDAWEPYLVPA